MVFFSEIILNEFCNYKNWPNKILHFDKEEKMYRE